MCTLAHTK